MKAENNSSTHQLSARYHISPPRHLHPHWAVIFPIRQDVSPTHHSTSLPASASSSSGLPCWNFSPCCLKLLRPKPGGRGKNETPASHLCQRRGFSCRGWAATAGAGLSTHTHRGTHSCMHTHRKPGTESVLKGPTSFFMLQYLGRKQALHIGWVKLKSPAVKDKRREWLQQGITILNTQTSSHQIKTSF